MWEQRALAPIDLWVAFWVAFGSKWELLELNRPGFAGGSNS